MSVIRLDCADPDRLIEPGDQILAAWRGYTDEAAFIYAETDGEPHNTITPIARMREEYELDLVLRNNITTEEHPLGVYHPHAGLHHIKKENIGLIEVMGLAVLPARLEASCAVWTGHPERRGTCARRDARQARRLGGGAQRPPHLYAGEYARPSCSRRWARCSPACWRTPACTSARTRAARPSCASYRAYKANKSAFSAEGARLLCQVRRHVRIAGAFEKRAWQIRGIELQFITQL